MRLTGQELLDKVAELGDADKTELALETGYFHDQPDGRKRCAYAEMYRAIAEAKGIAPAKRGRNLGFKAKVLTTGAVLVGSRYCQDLGWEPGEQIQINKVGRKLVLERPE